MSAPVDDEPDLLAEEPDDEDDSLVEYAPTVPLRTLFRRFWPYTRDFRGRMVLSLLLTGTVPALSTASIYLYKILVDDVLTPRDFSLFPLVAAAYVGIAVSGGLLSFVDDYLCTWVGRAVRPEPAHRPVRPPAPDVARVLRAPPARRPHVAPLQRRQRDRAAGALRGHAGDRARRQDPDLRRAAVLPELEAHARLADRRAAVRAGVALLLHAASRRRRGRSAAGPARSRPSPRRA